MAHEIKHEQGAFRLYVDGKAVGVLEYSCTQEKVMTVTHTGVEKAYEGKGLARELFLAMVAYAQAEGYKVVPICPYVATMFKRMPEYQELLEKVES